MDAVRSKLSRTGFDVKSRDVSILSGGDEGLYGWVAVNYLLGRIGGARAPVVGSEKKTTVALADLGGGSACRTGGRGRRVDRARRVRRTWASRAVRRARCRRTCTFNGYGARGRAAQDPRGVGGGRAGGEVVGAHVASGKGTRAAPSSRTHACVHAGHAGHSCDRDCYGLDDKTMSETVTPAKDGGSFCGMGPAALDAIDAEKGCEHAPCSFGGAWAAPRAAGVTEFYAMSYVAERAVQCGAAAVPLTTPNAPNDAADAVGGYTAAGTIKPVCAIRVDQLGAKYLRSMRKHRTVGSARTWRTCTRCWTRGFASARMRR